MVSVEINPVPGLIRATPQTRPSKAWSIWLERFRAAQPDTRSPYWPTWNRHYSREVLRTAYTSRPVRIDGYQRLASMNGAEFALYRVRLSVRKFADSQAEAGGTVDATKRRDLVGMALVVLLEAGLDCTRHNGEINVFVDKLIWKILKRLFLELTSVVHVTAYGRSKKDTELAGAARLPNFAGLPDYRLNPEETAILHQAIGSMTDQAFETVLKRNKI